jgi:hypothetical protein
MYKSSLWGNKNEKQDSDWELAYAYSAYAFCAISYTSLVFRFVDTNALSHNNGQKFVVVKFQ